jgi:DNA polymerase beta
MNKECPDDKILNPKTKRCVSKTGALGKQLLQKENKPSSAAKSPKPKNECPDDKILNPKTKRCVSKTGALGKQLLQKENKQSPAAKSSKPKNECPDDKILNPKTKRCVSKTGALGKQLLQKENKHSSAAKSPKTKEETKEAKDLKKTIIRGLYIIKNYEKKYTNNKAIINACTKVISQLYNYNKPILSYKDFLSNIKADDYINKKIEELIKEGKIKFEKINKKENKPSSAAAKSSNEKDLKKTIISHLILIKQYEMANNNVFKAKAYQKVISQLNNCNEPILTYEDFVLHIKAGDRINKKVEELIREGKIKYEEENIKEDDVFKFRQALNKIYGIGEAKIKAIIKEGITSMDDLRKNQHLLNDKQKIGLAYYDDLNMRIPLDEYLKHKKILESDLKGLTYDFVGSFRRGATSMGDIDILIMKNDKFDLPNYIKKLQSSGYIKEILALGKLKTSCIVKIDNNPARQVDILVSPFNEYYFSLLYFTGSADFNIGFRNYVKTTYDVSLSEHGIKEDKLKLPVIKSEKDIFDFFKIKYVEPKKRKLFFTP